MDEVKERAVPEGVVKWFDPKKGYGFITTQDGKDVFVHYTFIPGDGYRKLEQGEKVIFELVNSHRGPQARNVLSTSDN
jgi:CspA family cold shock protein